MKNHEKHEKHEYLQQFSTYGGELFSRPVSRLSCLVVLNEYEMVSTQHILCPLLLRQSGSVSVSESVSEQKKIGTHFSVFDPDPDPDPDTERESLN